MVKVEPKSSIPAAESVVTEPTTRKAFLFFEDIDHQYHLPTLSKSLMASSSTSQRSTSGNDKPLDKMRHKKQALTGCMPGGWVDTDEDEDQVQAIREHIAEDDRWLDLTGDDEDDLADIPLLDKRTIWLRDTPRSSTDVLEDLDRSDHKWIRVIDVLHRKSKQQITALKDKLQAERFKYVADISQFANEHNKAFEQCKAKQKQLDAEIEKHRLSRQRHASAVEQLAEEQRDALDELNADQKAAIEMLQAEHQEELDSIRAQGNQPGQRNIPTCGTATGPREQQPHTALPPLLCTWPVADPRLSYDTRGYIGDPEDVTRMKLWGYLNEQLGYLARDIDEHSARRARGEPFTLPPLAPQQTLKAIELFYPDILSRYKTLEAKRKAGILDALPTAAPATKPGALTYGVPSLGSSRATPATRLATSSSGLDIAGSPPSARHIPPVGPRWNSVSTAHLYDWADQCRGFKVQNVQLDAMQSPVPPVAPQEAHAHPQGEDG